MSSGSLRRRVAFVALPLALGALAFAPAAFAGGFVIGNGNAAVGTHVTFWGAQWWKLNTLSGGEAPSSFKGWVNSFSTPGCGLAWTTRTGNASEPPATLPEFIEVVVASKIIQDGSIPAGNTPKIALVKTDTSYEKKSGYMPDPGHEGTGTVVGIVCEEQEVR
jgi:hypothetical protein